MLGMQLLIMIYRLEYVFVTPNEKTKKKVIQTF